MTYSTQLTSAIKHLVDLHTGNLNRSIRREVSDHIVELSKSFLLHPVECRVFGLARLTLGCPLTWQAVEGRLAFHYPIPATGAQDMPALISHMEDSAISYRFHHPYHFWCSMEIGWEMIGSTGMKHACFERSKEAADKVKKSMHRTGIVVRSQEYTIKENSPDA